MGCFQNEDLRAPIAPEMIYILSEYWIGLPKIMDKSVDTFEQNKHFLSTSLRKFKKHFFCL